MIKKEFKIFWIFKEISICHFLISRERLVQKKKKKKSCTRWNRGDGALISKDYQNSRRMNLLYLALSPFAHPTKLFSSSIFEAKELFKGAIPVHFWILPLTSFRLENERRSAYIFPPTLFRPLLFSSLTYFFWSDLFSN